MPMRIGMVDMIDDHEVINDYDGQATDAVYATARSAWLDYAGSMNPALPASAGDMAGERAAALYFSFEAGPHATVFVLDTRSYRQGMTNRTHADECHDHEASPTTSPVSTSQLSIKLRQVLQYAE